MGNAETLSLNAESLQELIRHVFKEVVEERRAKADRLLNESEAAVYLGLSVHSLRNGRSCMNRGIKVDTPPFLRFGGRTIRYRRSELDAWAAGNMPGGTVSEIEGKLMRGGKRNDD